MYTVKIVNRGFKEDAWLYVTRTYNGPRTDVKTTFSTLNQAERLLTSRTRYNCGPYIHAEVYKHGKFHTSVKVKNNKLFMTKLSFV